MKKCTYEPVNRAWKRLKKTFEVSDSEDSLFVYLLISVLLVVFFIYCFYLDYELFLWLGDTEGSPVEILTALFYAAAGFILVGTSLAGIKRGRRARTRNFIILLGLLFLFVAGEELSWGQFLIGFSIPEKMKYINQQGEWNLHNIDLFRSRYITVDNLADLFIFIVGVVLPLLNFFSAKSRKFFKKIHFPVVPLSCIPFFFLGLAYVHVLNFLKIIPVFETLEFKEFIFSLGFFLFAISVLTSKHTLLEQKERALKDKKK